MLQDRTYQEECLGSIVKHYLEGVYQQLVVMATGTGKTVVFSRLIGVIKSVLGLSGKTGKVLVFAHREELIDQAIKSIRRSNPELKVGKEMADDYADTDCDVIVSCVASIGRNGSTRLSRFGEFDVVICDEAHHSIAETYMRVFENTGIFTPGSKKLLLGFTATPKRKNLKRKGPQQSLDEDNILSLKSVYKKIVYTYPIRKAIKEGWLVPLRGYRITTDTDLSDIKTTAGDFQQDQLSNAVNTPERNALVTKSYIMYGENRQTVIFTVDIAHAKDLASMLRANGVKAEAVWGNDPERAKKLEQHKNKDITVLCNAQVLTEGYDDWQVSCVALAAPTRNSSKYTQEVGRGTRIQDGSGNLLQALLQGKTLSKVDCIVLDIVDNSKRCSLVTLPSLVGLNDDFDLKGGELVKTAEEVEALQEKYPGVDLTGLKSLDSIQAYVEQIDILADPFTEDVKNFSKFSWMPQQDGSYVLSIPEKEDIQGEYHLYLHEKLYISQNELEEWELKIASTKDSRLLWTGESLQETFSVADDVIRRCRNDRLKLLLREAPWHNRPATAAAKKYLKKLLKKQPFLYCLCDAMGKADELCLKCGKKFGVTGGQVARAINKLQHTK